MLSTCDRWYLVKEPTVSHWVVTGRKISLAHCKNVFTAYINPFAPGDFAEKRVLKLVEWFSGHCRAIKS